MVQYIRLPGKAYARRQHVWLTGANEVDSKTFSRAILAKVFYLLLIHIYISIKTKSYNSLINHFPFTHVSSLIMHGASSINSH